MWGVFFKDTFQTLLKENDPSDFANETSKQLQTVDVLALVSMKNAAKCEK